MTNLHHKKTSTLFNLSMTNPFYIFSIKLVTIAEAYCLFPCKLGRISLQCEMVSLMYFFIFPQKSQNFPATRFPSSCFVLIFPPAVLTVTWY